MCHGHEATISGPGTLKGTSSRDVIVGTAPASDDEATELPEWQKIYAGGGNDLVCAGPGHAHVFGGRGDDRIYGEGDFTYYVGDFDPFVVGDILEGGPGNDFLAPGFDSSHLNVNYHTPDQVSYAHSSGGVTADLGAGRVTGQGRDRLRLNDPHKIFVTFSIVGSEHDDVLRGDAGSDELQGLGGDDVIFGRDGNDFLVGGRDNDRLAGQANDDNLTAGSGKDRLTGGSEADRLEASGGDVALGGGGNDWVVSESAKGRGPRVLRGGDGGDRIELVGIRDQYVVDGGAGKDLLRYRIVPADDTPVTLDARSSTFTVGATRARMLSIQRFNVHVAGPLRFIGSDGSEQLRLKARGGLTAHLHGGNDTVTSGASDDTVNGGRGTDTADLGDGTNVCTSVESGPC